ncbi:MAG TPA: nucleoside-diphosphate kinase [candidate division Zixibacteria bacterium]|nr:nucleoside-diphosphate kinase [candidate division Zixibacteria bacterium]
MTTLFQSTFVLIKPNAIQRELVGEIISRFENKGLRIDAIKMLHMSRDLAERHYGEHRDKPFYNDLIEFITSGPVIAMVLSGPDAIDTARYVVGDTDPLKAHPGTIRGQYAITTAKNIVHASDCVESARKEIARFFAPEEVLNYSMHCRASI